MPPQGFDGIAVALVGNNTPFGTFISSLFFGVINQGKEYMQAQINVQKEISDTIIAVIVYFAATSVLFEKFKVIPRIKEFIKKKFPKKEVEVVEGSDK